MIKRHKSNKRSPGTRRSENGLALLEAALVAPWLTLMLLGVLDFGRLFYFSMAMANAARAGAQYGSLNPSNATNATAIAQAATQESQDIGAITITSQQVCKCPSGSTVNCTSGSCESYGQPQVFVEVTTNKIYQTLIPYPGIPHNVNVTRKTTLRVQ